LKNILKRYIPGFKTNMKWKKIIAIIYYIYSLLRFFTGGLGAFLITITLPFIIFSIISIIMNENRKKALIILICGVFLFVGGLEEYRILTSSLQVINVSAYDLQKAYKSNESKANIIYKNKKIKINGTISETPTTEFDGMLTISTGAFPNVDVLCSFNSGHMTDMNKVANMKKGDTVTIQGICEGGDSMGITIDDCEFK